MSQEECHDAAHSQSKLATEDLEHEDQSTDMKTYIKYPPRKLQSAGYDGPIEISKFEKFQYLREQLAKDGVNIALPTGN